MRTFIIHITRTMMSQLKRPDVKSLQMSHGFLWKVLLLPLSKGQSDITQQLQTSSYFPSFFIISYFIYKTLYLCINLWTFSTIFHVLTF